MAWYRLQYALKGTDTCLPLRILNGNVRMIGTRMAKMTLYHQVL